MIKRLNKSFYKNGYLLIIAAWLYTISFIFSNYWLYTSSPNLVRDQYEDYLKHNEKLFDKFASDSVLLTAGNLRAAAPATISGTHYFDEGAGLYLYRLSKTNQPTAFYWNNNRMLPALRDIYKKDGKYFTTYQNGDFEFIKKTVTVDGRMVIAAALIPLHWKYFVENRYLKSEFVPQKNLDQRYQLSPSGGDVEVKNTDGKGLFWLKEKQKDENRNPGALALLLKIAAVIFIMIFINTYSADLVHQKGFLKGFLFLLATVTLLRALSYYFNFPFAFRQLDLFQPSVYASNAIHPSLGDLFVNTVLLFWMVSFIRTFTQKHYQNFKPFSGRKALVFYALACILLIVISFSAAGITRSLIIDSKIPFTVTSFFKLNIFTLISFLVLCLMVLIFFELSHIILTMMASFRQFPVYYKYLVIALSGLLFLSYNLQAASSSSYLAVLIWLLFYLLVMEFRREDLYTTILRSSFFILWIIFFAASISALIISQNSVKDLDTRIKIAREKELEEYRSAADFIKLGLADIDSNFLNANFERMTYETGNREVKDSLTNALSDIFLNRYEVSIYTFNYARYPMYNEDSTSSIAFNSLIRTRGQSLDPEMAYYQNENKEPCYLLQKTITNDDHVLGYFYVLVKKTSYKSQAVYPELFNSYRTDNDQDVIYAVYNHGKLVTSYGDYNFSSRLPKDKFLRQEYREIRKDDVKELWYNAGNNKIIVIVTSQSIFFEAITLFAYLFVSFLFVILAFQAVLFLIRHKFSLRRILSNLRITLRSQIQGAIIFISVFSFLVIGITTIFFYIDRFKQTNRERLVKSVKTVSNEIESQFNNARVSQTFNNPDAVKSNKTDSILNNVTSIEGIDANLYNLWGELKSSTQPIIYNKQVLSSKMEPHAYNHLFYHSEIQVIQFEQVSHFNFLSVYIPIRDSADRTYAYLNIPYLNSQKELSQEISNFLVTLINLNAFIFVIAGAIAVFLTGRITSSFNLIANKMKAVNLGKANEKIDWNNDDEIGALVSEYNKMVQKLELSADALAKSEREGAWREMARQVAHEIKNPLTPMKLSIQYLQRAIQDNSPNVQELSKKVSATLVEQIDQLAKIASDFSQFANIGNVRVEVFDLREVLQSLVNLYTANPRLTLSYSPPTDASPLKADRTQINRLFTNLLQNAIEASDGQDQFDVVIRQVVNNGHVLINVTDNGAGIPEEKRGKIFTPNFTTKTSGTGLGLAICKGIVEKANGRIWFDTEEGRGTTFHVLLPLDGNDWL